MKLGKKGCLLAVIFLLGFVMISVSVLAADVTSEKNVSTEQQAVICLNESKVIFSELISENFTVTKVNDTLREAMNLFDAQSVLKEQKKTYDFSSILPKCKEIKDEREAAFSARYELEAFKKFYSDSITPGMNTSSVDKIVQQIEDEMKSERYEVISQNKLIDKAYGEIINVKSSYTTLNLFYASTTKSLKQFIYKNWVFIVSAVAALIILFLVYRKGIRRWMLNRKLNNLNIRKKTLQELIMQTQKDYFQYGKISESGYNIRTKKFAELIRDIDREIPLIKEELIKVGKLIEK